MIENYAKLTKELIKKVKTNDHKAGEVYIGEANIKEKSTNKITFIYPKIAKMKQDVGLSEKEKIKISYTDYKDIFEIDISFKEGDILYGFGIAKDYINLGNPEYNYINSLTLLMADEKVEIMSKIDDVSLAHHICLEENKVVIDNILYHRIHENVGINIERVKEIKKIKKIENIKLVIKKEKNTNSIEILTSLGFGYGGQESKLRNIEGKRLIKCLEENNIKSL